MKVSAATHMIQEAKEGSKWHIKNSCGSFEIYITLILHKPAVKATTWLAWTSSEVTSLPSKVLEELSTVFVVGIVTTRNESSNETIGPIWAVGHQKHGQNSKLSGPKPTSRMSSSEAPRNGSPSEDFHEGPWGRILGRLRSADQKQCRKERKNFLEAASRSKNQVQKPWFTWFFLFFFAKHFVTLLILCACVCPVA